MRVIRYFCFILIAYILLILSAKSYAYKHILTETTVKNFTYHLIYSDKKVTLQNGKYKSQLRIGNKEDMENFIKVNLIKYLITESFETGPFAVVILAESSGGSGTFFQITALVQENGEIVQTNSIELGDRVEIKDLKFIKGYDHHFRGRERDEILLTLLTHRENDPSCCPSKMEKKCFTFVRDENRKIQLLTCEEADKKYPLPIVKKPAVYLYPEKIEKVEVILNPDGNITKTIPEYKDKWIVTANPDGVIDDKYHYLFYEVELNRPIFLPEEGWAVYKKDLSTWFDKYLTKLGLNNREIKDFKDYWLKELQKHPFDYYEIKLLTNDFLAKNLQIKINPEPDTFIRIIFYFKPGFGIPEALKEPVIKTPERKGFTVVEWGGIMEKSNESDIKNPQYSLLPSEIGIIILKAVEIKDHKITIIVNTNGCTNKNSIKPVIKQKSGFNSRTHGSVIQIPSDNILPNHYEIIFTRQQPDFCKAFLPEGTIIQYDIQEELNIKMPYTLIVKNPIMPFTKNDPYFIFEEIKSEGKEEVVQEEGKSILNSLSEIVTHIRRDVKNATIYAINQEIKRYEQRKDEEKVKKLKEELNKIKIIDDKDFPIPEEAEPASNLEDVFQDKNKFEAIIPCKPLKVEIIYDRKYSLGEILNIKEMTKSGPFYHIAGIRDGIFDNLKYGNIYEANVCLVYKREYFGFIQDYYVYLADIK